MVIEPTIWIDWPEEERGRDAVLDFRRERLAKRYNRQWNAQLDAWSDFFTGGAASATVSAFGTQSGVDATFKIGKVTAFSAR